MVTALKQHQRYQLLMVLGSMTVICLGLLLFRMHISGSRAFLFLVWNLFLAFLPWAFSTWLIIHPQYQNNKYIAGGLLCSWILFFPNAPYILTDLFHLHGGALVPAWYDLVLILAYAWTGLLFGLTSLMDIEKIFSRVLSRKKLVIMISCLLFLAAFGIYLGRYLRWNSWDIIREPTGLLGDLADRFINPFSHPRTWGVTLFMGVLLNMMYWSFRLLRK